MIELWEVFKAFFQIFCKFILMGWACLGVYVLFISLKFTIEELQNKKRNKK